MNSIIYIEKELEKINFKIEEINGEIKHLIEEKKNQVLKNNIFQIIILDLKFYIAKNMKEFAKKITMIVVIFFYRF